MADALIGYTGFVGGNLARQMRFDEFYNSKNIEDIKGRKFDTIVCAGAPGVKWLANEKPIEDREAIIRLLRALRETEGRIVLISTIDAIRPHDAYGTHRADAEAILRVYRDATVVRLPACFGPGLRKGPLYDLILNHRLDKIACNAIYQWYPLRQLAADLAKIREMGIPTINLVSEPVGIDEVRQWFFPDRELGPARDDAPAYDVPTDRWEFMLPKAVVREEMAQFLSGAG